MNDNLGKLGNGISRLRIAKNLKQSELAYEAGISERTLQRLEAGEVVKSDGLLKVIAYLGRLDDVLESISTPALSPYELASAGTARNSLQQAVSEPPGSKPPKSRVRRSRQNSTKQGKAPAESRMPRTGSDIVWPEDQV